MTDLSSVVVTYLLCKTFLKAWKRYNKQKQLQWEMQIRGKGKEQ